MDRFSGQTATTMQITAKRINLEGIRSWREAYRLEMGCQIIHDSLHARTGWSEEYLICAGARAIGYGSTAVGGPWTGTPAVYEFYLAPHERLDAFDAFLALLEGSGAVRVEVQSNDVLSTVMLHTFAREVTSHKILFHDQATTAHCPADAIFRQPTASEAPDASESQLRWQGVVEMEGQIAATGGVLFHYNAPYADIFMEVAEPFRARGLGSFLVQELKRICYEEGFIPAARCNPNNVASRRTLQKAGFAPCGHILEGSVLSEHLSTAR